MEFKEEMVKSWVNFIASLPSKRFLLTLGTLAGAWGFYTRGIIPEEYLSRLIIGSFALVVAYIVSETARPSR